jgi:hypothetical protein
MLRGFMSAEMQPLAGTFLVVLNGKLHPTYLIQIIILKF